MNLVRLVAQETLEALLTNSRIRAEEAAEAVKSGALRAVHEARVVPEVVGEVASESTSPILLVLLLRRRRLAVGIGVEMTRGIGICQSGLSMIIMGEFLALLELHIVVLLIREDEMRSVSVHLDIFTSIGRAGIRTKAETADSDRTAEIHQTS